MTPRSEGDRRDFLDICDERYQTRATVLTSQLPVTAWHAQIGEPTVADSILDRLVHNAHAIELQGESMRKNQNPKPPEQKASGHEGHPTRLHLRPPHSPKDTP